MSDRQNDGGFILVTYKNGSVRYFYEEKVHSLAEASDFSLWKNFDPSSSVRDMDGTIVDFVALPYFSIGQRLQTFALLKTLLLYDLDCDLSELFDALANKAREHKPAQ